ncbi:ABC transporter ATP-binding protein [Aureimonas fodinaquatilis]|uniref:ABC transporter ATP-binding protein n=1 Tax=Aureimonas fodinaquatilis TaxID=2565783 RepID=A0A5B0E318_9HYPH|nr:ABC transporter ATP-binding protein [Aureimonas fodinaquatilis]KAA0972150.1 ABC transporter ATP-binding protein [Aureimonas fodinaquatilis]
MSFTAKSLAADGLVAGYGGQPVLHEVSFTANAGEILTVVGPNGSGKSTLIKTVLGLLRPTQGRILLDGKDITPLSPSQRANAGIGYVPQEANVFPNMTVLENLRLGLDFIQRKSVTPFDKRLDEVLELFPEIRSRLSARAGLLSGGQRQMVAMASALMAEPSVLALDEPSAGLSPRNAELLFEIISRIARSGVTLFLIEQNTRLGLGASDSGLVLVSGEVKLSGKASEILAAPEIRRLYLGGA